MHVAADNYVLRSCTMGWLRSVRSIKLYVSIAEYCLFCRALLQKRPLILSILLTKATPYATHSPAARWICNDSQYTVHRWICTCIVHIVYCIWLQILGETIGLFCRRALEKRLYSAKETYICTCIVHIIYCHCILHDMWSTLLQICHYAMALASRLLKITGLFCRISSLI